MKVKEESENVGLKVNIQKTLTAASQYIHSFILNWGLKKKNVSPLREKHGEIQRPASYSHSHNP